MVEIALNNVPWADYNRNDSEILKWEEIKKNIWRVHKSRRAPELEMDSLSK